MNWGKVERYGGIALAVYLLVVGISLLVGTAIPGWAIGAIATTAGVLILIGR